MPEGACYWNWKKYVEGQRAPRLGRLYLSLECIGPRVQVRSEMASSIEVHVLRLPCVVRGYHGITGCLRGALIYDASLPRPPHWSLHGHSAHAPFVETQ